MDIFPLLSVLSVDFWRLWWLWVACFTGLLSCYVQSEFLLVLEVGIQQRVGGRSDRGGICGIPRCGQSRKKAKPGVPL